ncbi:MAG: hypothetical protein IPN38_11695 [Flavobacteriales bacterium]|nr:hypothetical protein [Flavobacteriales bacterium]
MTHPTPYRAWPFLVWLGALALGSLPSTPLLGQSFMENKGQVRDQFGGPNHAVRYLLETPNNTITLRNGGFSYDTYTMDREDRPSGTVPYPATKRASTPLSLTLHYHRVDVELVGCDTSAWMEPQAADGSLSHFYTGEEPIIGVRSFAVVLYHNVYPHIDVEFVAGTTFEYNFILHPGADINAIQLRYTGANGAELKNGQVALQLAHGQLAERVPLSFRLHDRHPLDIHYEVRDSRSDRFAVGFAGLTGPVTRTVVIDPTPCLQWSTYYGGNQFEDAYDIRTDPAGNVLTSGITYSSNGIATAGAHQNTYNAQYDAYLVKMNAAGVRQWATYLGKSGSDTGYAVETDAAGNVYFAGGISGGGMIASAGAFQTGFGGGAQDAFLYKMTPGGVRIWGTLFGDSGWDDIYEVKVDAADNIFVVGTTTSTTGIATAGTHQTTAGGFYDGFLAKFSSTGARLWATYFGGSMNEDVNGLALDGAGNIIVVGATPSATGIASAGAHQTALSGTNRDGFIIKFNGTGGRLWGSYYGAAGIDVAWGVACDAADNIIVVGSTTSTTNTFGTVGTFDATHNGNEDGYVSTFTPAGVRTWSTYFGSANYDTAHDVALYSNGDIVVSGYSEGGTGMTTTGAAQTVFGGALDAYTILFNSSGARVWATYLGGTSVDFAWAVTAHAPNLVYIAGNTSSTNGVATPGAHDVALTGPDESLIAKYNFMPVVLPIELLAFDAEPEGAQHVRTAWTTATESNNAFFTVERSADAAVFSPVGTVDGAGNSQQSIRYTWLDTEPLPGLSYYRLRQTDFDGTSTLSAVEAVQRGTGPVAVLGNPVYEVLALALPGPMRVEVVDAAGRSIYSALLSEGTQRIPAQSWDAGVYHVITTSGTAVSSQKVVVLR